MTEHLFSEPIDQTSAEPKTIDWEPQSQSGHLVSANSTRKASESFRGLLVLKDCGERLWPHSWRSFDHIPKEVYGPSLSTFR
jgi:hypothetical protein